MSDIIATEKGIYDLHTVDGCYRYLGESGLGSRELAALERIYKSALTTPATVPSEPGRLRGAPPSKEPKVRELESAYIEQGAILEWIQMILDGKEVSDFALSYPIVRQVWDLKQEAKHE